MHAPSPLSPPSYDPSVEVAGAGAVEVAALLGDSVVGVRHVSDVAGGKTSRRTHAMFAGAAILLVSALAAFVVAVRVAQADAVRRHRHVEIEQRPAWEFRPTPIGRVGDVVALGGLFGGLGLLGWALVRRQRERAPADVTIGRAAGVDFPVELGGERFALVAPRGAGFVLRVPAGAAVEPAIVGRGEDGGIEAPIQPGARYRVAAGSLSFVVAAVNAPRRHAGGARLERRVLAYLGGSALAHLTVLALLRSLAPDAGSLNDDDIGVDGRLAFVRAVPPEDQKKEPEPSEPGGEVGGEDGAATAGTSGKMGKTDATATEGRFQHQKRDDQPRLAHPRDRAAAREYARNAGVLGYFRANTEEFTHLTSTDMFSSGLDDRTVYGGHIGTEIGEAAGGWGYGIHGFGPGAGGTNGQSIAVGEYGLTGPGGDGTGDRFGFGTCKPGQTCGGGRGHEAKVPPPRIGDAVSDGGLDKQIIRQHIRKKLPQIRHCYERALIGSPTLAGTSTAQFQISPQGVVQGSKARGLGGDVDDCIADIISTIQFPAPRNGSYVNVSSYPFTFVNPGT